MDHHNAKLAPRWFKVSSEADAKAWDQEVKARLISTDESEAGRAFVEPHGQNLISCNALPEGSERERK